MDAARDMIAAGIANAFSSALLNPWDVTKVRLQSSGGPAVYKDLPTCLSTIIREEGAAALWLTGLPSSMLREALYSTTRMGLYPHVKAQLGSTDSNLLGKICAGAMTGGLGSIISNPVDVVKVGIMAEAGAIGSDGRYSTGLRAGEVPRWPNTLSALRSVVEEGHSLRGAVPSVLRGMLMAASQLASYDHSKYLICVDLQLVADGPKAHVLCSQISAVCATLVTAPADMIKTRVMGDLHGLYRGPLDCVMQTCQRDGVLALWRGALPSFLRIGPHFLITFPLYEQLRRYVGLGYL